MTYVNSNVKRKVKLVRGGSFVLVLLLIMAVCAVSGCTGAADDTVVDDSGGTGGTGSMASASGDSSDSLSGDDSADSASDAVDVTAIASLDVIESIDDYQDVLDSVDELDVYSIVFDGDSVESDAGDSVDVDGSAVYIIQAGAYSFSGESDEGRIVVDLSDKGYVRIILDGLELGSSSGSPIAVLESKATVIEIADGTRNVITDESAYVDPDVDENAEPAAIFSKDDLYVTGSGSLSVSSLSKSGIQSKDQLVVLGGTITVDAAKEAIKAKDYLVVEGGSLTLTAGEDGMAATADGESDKGFIAILGGVVAVDSDGDGLQAETYVIINGGSIEVLTHGTADSSKGIKAGSYVEINGGMVDVDSVDDAIHSSDAIVINGGTVSLASSDDGIHADVLLTINDGDVTVIESYEGLESKNIVINGGNMWIYSSDDGINVATGSTADGGAMGRMGDMAISGAALTINGGYVYMEANGDGLDSNGNFYMTGGTVLVNGPLRNDNGGLDVNGEAVVDGGTIVIAGSLGMAEAPDSTSEQNSVSVGFSSQLAAGTLVYIESDDGNLVVAFEPSKAFQSFVFSSDGLVTGETYRVYTGGTGSGESVDGLYEAVSDKGTLLQEFTVSSVTTSVGSASTMGGGMRPGMTGMASTGGMQRMR